MDVEHLDSLANEVIGLLSNRTKDEIAYIIGKLLVECLNEVHDGVRYQQLALMNIIAATYNQSGLYSGEKEMRAEPFRSALEILERFKIDSR